MDCVVCQLPGGYNRAVVDGERGVELGCLCVNCEAAAFDEDPDDLGEPGQETCVFCDRDGFWLLPKWLPSTYEADGKTVSYVDYDPTNTALRLCDEHLADIGVEDLSRPTDEDGPTSVPGRAED